MNNRINTIRSICKKDLIGLTPLVLLVIALMAVETLITKMDLDVQGEMWFLLTWGLTYLTSAAVGLLIIAVFQQDTPASLSHDWLIRPIAKHDLFLAKIVFLLLAAALPLILLRLLMSMLSGHSFMESILEASVFKTPVAMIGIVVFIMIGIISRTVLQALGMVVGLLLFLAVVTMIPIVTVPHPDKINFTGFQWLISVSIFIGVLVCLWFVAWFQYTRRDAFKAQMSIAIALLIGVFGIVASYQLPMWPPIYAVFASFSNELDAQTSENIILDSLYSCYPAVKIGNDLYGDAQSPQQGVKGLSGIDYFTAFELGAAGSNGIVFSTKVQARNLPADWRVVAVNATATFSAQTAGNSFRFTPAAGATPAGVNARSDGTHFWALTEQQVERFSGDGSTQLSVELDVAVLEPRQYVLEPDNRRRYFPGAGFCSAQIDSIKNELQVECFNHGARPVLVSAEIEGIPASRVDAAMPDFSPNFLQLLGGSHYRMNIASASLLHKPKALITVFEQRAYLNKQLNTPGVLGADEQTCPLPNDDYQGEALLTSWSDSSPHQSSLINVDSNVRLEVLEWPYVGEAAAIQTAALENEETSSELEIQTLVLLAGGGATAHSYDDIAPRLAQHFRVVAITRRGFGGSSKASSGYDMPRLTKDVVQVMDSMNIANAILVGHSMGGDELSGLAAHYPQRVAGLVYIDAAYDRVELLKHTGASLRGLVPPTPRPFPEELQSYSAMQKYYQRIGSVGTPEGSYMSSYDFASGASSTDQRLGQAIMAQIVEPAYSQITAPAVSLYAIEEISGVMRSWYDPADEMLRRNVEQAYQLRSKFQAEQIAAFKQAMPHAQVIEIVGADHAMHISHEDEVVAAILNLAQSLPQQAQP